MRLYEIIEKNALTGVELVISYNLYVQSVYN